MTKNPFFRGFVAISGGAAIAQALSVLLSPIITRIYLPEVLGIFSLVMALGAMITPAMTMTYDIAIPLPRHETEAKALLCLSVIISLVSSVLILAPLLLFSPWIAARIGATSFSPYLFLLAPLLALVGIENSLQKLTIRHKRFNTISSLLILATLVANGLKIGFGLFYPTAVVLFIISIAIHLLSCIFLIWRNNSAILNNPLPARGNIPSAMRQVAVKFADFPKFRLPQVVLNNISRNIPTLLLAFFFHPEVVGLYVLCQRVLKTPSALVGSAIVKILLPHLAETAQNNKPLRPVIVKATMLLISVSIIPFALIFIFGPALFGRVFGSFWADAGHYARWLAPSLFFGLINVPSVQAIPIMGLQKQLLLFEIFCVILRPAAIIAGGLLLRDPIQTIMLFSLAGVAINFFLISGVFYYSGRHAVREL